YYVFIWSVLAGIGLQQSLLAGDTVSAVNNKNVAPVESVLELEPEPEPDPKPRLIENPLPLPKKHEKKEMDYQYEVAEDKMKFDIEIKENDDFDR
ncbi:MAG: hypothetical protein NC489_46070, partial [Ruminococcus flavefaciens]|nr:hypothetical protein [Ruminococcus flavefaciens]